VRAWCGLVLALACGRPDADAPRPDPVPTPTPTAVPDAPTKPTMPALTCKLLVSTTTVAMKQRGAFTVGVEATNTSGATVETRLSSGGCKLTVNGAPSMAWNLAIGNGARDPSWFQLPPGKTVAMSWPLGKELFPKPGSYHLVLSCDGHDVATDVEVTP
jgi:hypothetical protein